MVEGIQSPAQVTYWFVPGHILFLLLNLLGLACFSYIVARRLTPLIRGERDFRFDRPFTRLERLLQFWVGQWKHPRYRTAGIMHILIFAGFIILATQAFSLLIFGFIPGFTLPGSYGGNDAFSLPGNLFGDQADRNKVVAHPGAQDLFGLEKGLGDLVKAGEVILVMLDGTRRAWREEGRRGWRGCLPRRRMR